MIYYGFDPGEKTGVVGVKLDGKKIVPTMIPTNMDEDELFRFLELGLNVQEPCMFIIEGFWLEPYKRPEHHLAWDELFTVQVIGMLRYVARRNGIEVELQKNSIKPMGYGYANQKYVRGKRGTHWQDAMAHVYYYLVTKKIGLPA